MAEETGELIQEPSGCQWEWKIPSFWSLPEEPDRCYSSGEFFFSGACWELRLYPDGQSKFESEGWISLYLLRMDRGVPLTLGVSLGIRKADGTEEILFRNGESRFTDSDASSGKSNYLQRSALLCMIGAILDPENALTITCSLKADSPHSMEASLFRRLWHSSVMLRGLLASGEESGDVTFKLQDGTELRAHTLILKARSEVFKRKFTTDVKEPQVVEEVDVPGADRDSFGVVLAYLYCGEPEGLSWYNVCKVYEIARKYDLGELARLCAEYMKECLSEDTLCDVIPLADLYQEKDLQKCARKFFVKNATKVFKTAEWETLKMENASLVVEFLQSAFEHNAVELEIAFDEFDKEEEEIWGGY